MMDEISNALRSLKMPGMAHYWTTMQETRQHDSLSLKDGLQLLIQAELDNRTTSRNTRLMNLFSAMGCPKSLVRVSGRWHPIAS